MIELCEKHSLSTSCNQCTTM